MLDPKKRKLYDELKTKESLVNFGAGFNYKSNEKLKSKT
jgi:hypothetical protein